MLEPRGAEDQEQPISLNLRPATVADYDFLFHVLKATMRDYVDQTWGWRESEQQARFADEFTPEHDRIIVLAGVDIGVLAVEHRADEVFIDKLYILPAYQRRGIGTRLIRDVLAEASREGLPVRLRVLKVNPARRLYERLGFVVVDQTDPSYVMRAQHQRIGDTR